MIVSKRILDSIFGDKTTIKAQIHYIPGQQGAIGTVQAKVEKESSTHLTWRGSNHRLAYFWLCLYKITLTCINICQHNVNKPCKRHRTLFSLFYCHLWYRQSAYM